MTDPEKGVVQARLRGALDRMAPEDRKRAIEAAKARLELIHRARLAGLAVETPEQIRDALRRLGEAAERQAKSDD